MTVSLHMNDGVAIIEIDDGKKNVINHAVLDELEAAWDEAEAQAATVIFKGRTGSFCAGYDIRVMTGPDQEAASRLGKRGGAIARRIYGFERPVVGLSEGHAFTIGAVWLAGCDVRIAERGAYKYAMTEVALDVPLTGWALPAISARIKPQYHEEVLLHSSVCDPEAAAEVGFVDQVVDPGHGLDAALAAAAKLKQLPAKAYRQTKLTLRADVLTQMDQHLG